MQHNIINVYFEILFSSSAIDFLVRKYMDFV